MHRNITDIDVAKWNDRLKNNYRIIIDNKGSIPDLYVMQLDYSGSSMMNIPDPEISYLFSFSVVSNKKADFFDIFNKLMQFKINAKKKNSKNNFEFGSIIKSKSEVEHNIFNLEYTKYSFEFKGNILDIMIYIMILEDTIDIFHKIWEFNDKGESTNILEHKIGKIVSLSHSKDKDYLIIDYVYNQYNGKYEIEYKLIELKSEIGSAIIEYGDISTANNYNIITSRNNNLGIILN